MAAVPWEPAQEPEPERPWAEAAAEPWAARARTGPWQPRLQPWRLCSRPYTRPRRWPHRPWPPWPWRRPPRPARPGRERAKRPAWPPPASPPASSTSSTYLPPLAREFLFLVGGGPSKSRRIRLQRKSYLALLTY